MNLMIKKLKIQIFMNSREIKLFMKLNYLKTILINISFLIFALLGYFFPKYSWSIQIVLFILTCLGIFCSLFLMKNIEILPKELKIKFDSFMYNVIDYFFDIMALLLYIYLDYKVLFFLYVIFFLSTITLKIKYKESKIK